MQKEAFVTNQNPADQLTAIKENNEAALKALYQQNYPKIETYVLNNNGTEEEAKDIYQEAFIAVWRNIQLNKFTPVNETSLAGYLFQVAKNKWLDHLRSGHYKNIVSLNGHENGTHTIEELPDQQQVYLTAVRTNFAKLGNTCRDLLNRFYFQKESLRTIALSFRWTEATTKNNKYRCIQQLRELIKNS